MKYKLGEVCEIIAGQIINRVSCEKDEAYPGARPVTVLLPSAINGGMIDADKLGYSGMDTENWKMVVERMENRIYLKKDPEVDPTLKEKFTKKSDILMKLSSPYDCALITADVEDILVPSFCAIIRVRDDKIDPEYKVYESFLMGVLNSKRVRDKLLMGVQSTAMSMVRIKTLKELEIDFPPSFEQSYIGAAYYESCRRRWLLDCMARNQQEISDAIMEVSLDKYWKEEGESGNE